MSYEDDEDDWYEDDAEVWDAEDASDPEDDLVPCPQCKKMIYEDAELCPYCDQYVTPFSTANTSRPPWIIITALVLLVIMLLGYLWPIL